MEIDFLKEIKDEDYEKLYEINDKIGRGQFGKVFKGINKKSKKMRAIKIIEIYNNKDNNFIKNINNELNNMKICSKDNDNSVKYYEHFHYKDKFVIVMELCDNSLQNILDERKEGFTCKQIFNIMSQLNNTFKIMHKNNIIHRDLKLDNILVKYKDNNNNNNDSDINFIVKLTDYGISKQLKRTINTTSIGTIQTMAPEILEGKNKYGYACDLWSIGIIIYQLFFKEYPYKGETQVAIYKQIEELGKKVLKTTKNEKLDNLINSLLIRDPEKRINYEKYFNHPFFKENYIKNSCINNNNINLKSRNMRNKTKTSINLQKESSIINNYETSNYNNSPLKIDLKQSSKPKQNQKKIKRFHLLSSIIKQSAFSNNLLKKYEIFNKTKSLSPKSSDIKSSSILNKGDNNYNNSPLKTDINKSFLKIQRYQENNKRTLHNSPKIKKSIIDNNQTPYYNPLKNYISKKPLKNNKNFVRYSTNIKRSINHDKLTSKCYDRTLKNNLTKSFSIEQFNHISMETNELTKNSSIKKGRSYLNIHENTGKYNNNYKQYIPQKEITTFINIKDLLALEEKLKEIIIAINKNGTIYNECLEFWNYYYVCSFYGKLEKLFKTENDQNNIKISINYILLSVIICYDYSYEMVVLKEVISNLIDIMNLNYRSLIIIYEHILSIVNIESKSNIWVLSAQSIS